MNMFFRYNNSGAQVSDNNGVKVLVITERMLKEFDHSNEPVFAVKDVLTKYFPEVISDKTYSVDLVEAYRQARDAVIHSSALNNDPLFMTRVWFMAVESVLNHKNVYFKLRFPYIEGNEP